MGILAKQKKLNLYRWLLISLFLSFTIIGEAHIPGWKNKVKANYISLSGKILASGNPVGADGNIRKFNSAVLHLKRSNSEIVKGTLLVIPGGDYEQLNIRKEGAEQSELFNSLGFDVAILEYHIGTGAQVQKLALKDAIEAYRLLKTKLGNFDLQDSFQGVVGFSSGGNLAAQAVQVLGDNEQPENLILLNPTNFDETIPGTVFPAVMPPLQPKRLFCAFTSFQNREWVKSTEEYAKTWKGYDGEAYFQLLADTTANPASDKVVSSEAKLPGLLKIFLETKQKSSNIRENPAAIPVATKYESNLNRFNEKLALVKKNKYDLILIGNSIIHILERPDYQSVWNQFYAPRNALDLGFSGFRTEQINWTIQSGILDGQSPKVIVLEIGTNNIDEKHYPTRHTAGQLAGGIEAIVNLMREKCPGSKIILLRCFPGSYDGPNPTSHRAILERASDIVSKLADGKHVFYCDVNHVFLNMDGSVNRDMLFDWLHPSPAGAKAWAQAMEPLLSELMGDKSHDTEISSNSAIVPVPKLENDFYNWWDRHAEVLRIKDSINPQIVLIGNSITHKWGGEPEMRNSEGKLLSPQGPKAWDSAFSNYRVLNLGFGWDRTQNVLWRLDHGELDGLHPRYVIIHIGTNNTSQTENARANTSSEIVEGIQAIVKRVRSKVPRAKIVLMGIMPREQYPEHPRRQLINETNHLQKVFAEKQKITFLDISSKMLTSVGILTKDIAGDFCHPTEKGYQIWADEIKSQIFDY